MVRTCVDSTLAELPLISEQDSSWADEMVDKIHSCKLGLRFLRMFFWSLYTLEDTDDAENRDISIAIWGRSRNQLVALDWIMDVQGRIHQCKQTFEQSCQFLLQRSLRCNSFKMKVVLNFMNAILKNLNDLYKYKADDEIVLLKILEKKLRLLRNLLLLIPKGWRGFKEMREFKVAVNAFAHYSASLIFLYWATPIDEERATKLNLLLSNVLEKIKPRVPVFKAFYFRFLEEMKSRQLDSLLFGQIVQIFIELLLENLVDILKDDFQILQESLLFVISFLANPPDQHGEDKELMTITAEIEVIVKEELYTIFSDDDMKGKSFQANECLRGFKRKVEQVKGKIQQVYDQFPDSFSYDLPNTNGLGFFNFLLQNLNFLTEKLNRDKDFIPFAKHLIIKIEEELLSLRPYLNDLFEQQKTQTELMSTWLNVIELAYQTEYAINSSLVIGHRLWYNMARLMEVLKKIKDVKIKLKKIEGRKTHDGGVLHCSAVALGRLKVEDPWTSGFNEVMVDLKKEVNIIVGHLINGSKSLDIVAIVGMPGLGKTTMANMVYNAPLVRNHFYMFAYCIVSQFYSTRRILLDILADIRGKDDKMYDKMEEDKLADMLRKCLLNQKYLIIIDDIWDVKAWDEVKSYLPINNNGSRVIFTTRIRNVAFQAKEDCILHHLRFLSDKESWELLRKKVFRAEGCPPTFLKVGKMIAKNCKGLPSTIVSVADLLVGFKTCLSRWNIISETVGSTEGCMNGLESSYQHLPEHLKPCFLYFGAFAEDRLICVNKLTLLWIAEGFVQNSNMKNLKNLAKEYLCDLVDRSLVIANERSSYGGIKSCRIHDLVREFCQRKAQEENFLQLMDIYEASNSSSSTVRNPYRVCIHMKGKDLGDAEEICPTIPSLLKSCKTYHGDYHYVSNLKLVQVMFLEELKWDTCFIARVIASLVHLRFIATSFPLQSRIIVPCSISNLWNLETLILTVKGSGRSKLELPGTVWNMTRLKHVDVGMCYLSSLGFKKREAYPQMVNLESFSSPYISSTEDLEDLLQRLPSLKKLGFHYDLNKGFHFPELDSLCKLESLKVSSARDPSLNSFNFLSTLKKLSLSDCLLHWGSLPKISKMPCLEVLKLLDNSFVWNEWDMKKTEFPKLKFLKLQGLLLAEWIVPSKDSFPSLEVLIVNRCSNLNSIPPCFGEMPTLERIEVYASPKAATEVVEIQEAQKDINNEGLQVIVSDSEFRDRE